MDLIPDTISAHRLRAEAIELAIDRTQTELIRLRKDHPQRIQLVDRLVRLQQDYDALVRRQTRTVNGYGF